MKIIKNITKKLVGKFHKHKNIWEDKKKRRVAIVVGIVGILLVFRIVQAISSGASIIDTNSKKSVSLIDVKETLSSLGEVKASGIVEASEQVELSSEVSARVAYINTTLGAEVYGGQILVGFVNGGSVSSLRDSQARVEAARAALEQQEANLESQKSRLEEVKRGARPEELNIAETNLENATNNVKEAEISLERAEENAEKNVESTMKNSASSLLKSIQTAKDTIFSATRVQYTYFHDNTQKSLAISNAKERAIWILFGQEDAGKWNEDSISILSGPLKAEINEMVVAPDEYRIKGLADQVIEGLRATITFYESIPLESQLSSGDINILISEKQRLQAELTSVISSREAIDLSKTSSNSAIQAARSALTNAVNQEMSAKDNLALVVSGATKEQLQSAESAVKQAEAAVRSSRASLASAQASVGLNASNVAKTIIRTPINGKIATLNVRVGELVSPGQKVASVVNTNAIKIKTFVDSSQLAAVFVGSKADIQNGNAKGEVTFVSPAIDPQTRKVEVHIIVTERSDAKPLVVGQYVDVVIESSENTNSLVEAILPLQSVEVTPEGTAVFVVKDGKVEAVQVSLGRVQGKSVEVVAGLSDVEMVIDSVRGLSIGDEVETSTK